MAEHEAEWRFWLQCISVLLRLWDQEMYQAIEGASFPVKRDQEVYDVAREEHKQRFDDRSSVCGFYSWHYWGDPRL